MWGRFFMGQRRRLQMIKKLKEARAKKAEVRQIRQMFGERRKSKWEFSKLHVIYADALVAFVWVSTVLLAYFDKQTISDVAVAIITIYGAFATGGYFAQNSIRSVSSNNVDRSWIEHARESESEEIT
jgi:hypothetical protein